MKRRSFVGAVLSLFTLPWWSKKTADYVWSFNGQPLGEASDVSISPALIGGLGVSFYIVPGCSTASVKTTALCNGSSGETIWQTVGSATFFVESESQLPPVPEGFERTIIEQELIAEGRFRRIVLVDQEITPACTIVHSV